jgi:hypothetical protein
MFLLVETMGIFEPILPVIVNLCLDQVLTYLFNHYVSVLNCILSIYFLFGFIFEFGNSLLKIFTQFFSWTAIISVKRAQESLVVYRSKSFFKIFLLSHFICPLLIFVQQFVSL